MRPRVRAAIVDRDIDVPPGGQIGHAHPGAKRQRLVRGAELDGVKRSTIGANLARLVTVEGCPADPIRMGEHGGGQQRASASCPQREALQDHVDLRNYTDVQRVFRGADCLSSAVERAMLDNNAYAREIAALLIADIRTSGAQTAAEIREAFRVSLRSLIGDAEIPAQIALVMPTGAERWPQVVVKRRKLQDE